MAEVVSSAVCPRYRNMFNPDYRSARIEFEDRIERSLSFLQQPTHKPIPTDSTALHIPLFSMTTIFYRFTTQAESSPEVPSIFAATPNLLLLDVNTAKGPMEDCGLFTESTFPVPLAPSGHVAVHASTCMSQTPQSSRWTSPCHSLRAVLRGL